MDDNTWSVYRHINLINGKQYIGITSQEPERRWGSNGCKYQKSYFRNAIDKYGWDNFYHEIIFSGLSEKDAKYLEKLLIQAFNTKKPNGYNMTDGGDGTLGYIPTEETLLKMSASSKSRWKNEEYKNKVITARHLPDSIYQSEEFKNKISSLVTGEKNPNYQHYWSDKMKQALREKQKNNPMYHNETNPNAKAIRCIETGEIFNCMKYAQEKYGLKSSGTFTHAIKTGKTAVGFHWEYV